MIILGMNKFKPYPNKGETVKQLVVYVLHLLQNKAYNPITQAKEIATLSDQELEGKPIYGGLQVTRYKIKCKTHEVKWDGKYKHTIQIWQNKCYGCTRKAMAEQTHFAGL